MRQIRKKALALTRYTAQLLALCYHLTNTPSRVAVHLKSPRTRSTDAVEHFYTLLLNAETWETDGISSILTMHQDSAPVSVELDQSEVHIADNEIPLKICVPHGEVSQDVCFGSALPDQLVRWMVTDPTTQQIEGKLDESVTKVVTGILGTKYTAAMSRIFDMQGIIDIDIPHAVMEATD